VARKFGLGRSAIDRHARSHLAARLRRAAEERASGSDPELLDELFELNRITKGILAKAYNTGDLQTALAAIARAEKQIELEARLLGRLREGGGATVNVNVIDDDAAIRMAKVFLQRRGGLLAGGEAIEGVITNSEEGEKS
jgi:hypothetical protein